MVTSAVSSSIDVNAIVTQLMQVESKPLTVLQTKEAGFLSKISAYGTVKGSLSSFQSAVNALSSPSLFTAQNVTASDPSVLSGSASLLATGSGSYDITVNTLAKSQKLSSTAQASTISTIGTGAATTISFQFGTISGGTLTNGAYSGASFTPDASQATTTLTIDSSNNSLQGIRDAINRANVGVKATIVNDGAPGTPFHLTLTSAATGAVSSMKISASGDPDVAALLSYDPAGAQNFTQTDKAQNANLTIDGQAITSATNTVKDAIAGVTLNLTKGDGATTTLSLSNNTAPVASAVSALVKAYNDTNSTLKKMTAYDPTTQTGGLLHGDATIIAMQTKLRATFATALSGMGGNTLTNITQLGISFQKDGTLALDSGKLQTALNNNFGDFATLFTNAGKSSDSLVSFAGSTSNSVPGSYAVNVTSLATRGSASGVTKASGLAGSTAANLTIGAGNNQLQVAVDGGATLAVTLTGGTYADAAALASQVQTDINAALTLAGQSGQVAVTQNGGKLTISSAAPGPGATLAVTDDPGFVGNTGATSLLGTPAKLSTITAGVNDQLTVAISGTTATVTLAAGTYTSDSLAQQVQAAINNTSAFSAAGIAVSASSANDTLSVTSTRYGATSGVNITGGSAFADLFSGLATPTPGTDVAGTIDGIAATGSGQFLTGSSGPSSGVKLQVVGGTLGARGSVNFSQGYAYLLNAALDSMLGDSGALASNTNSANNSIASLHKQADNLQVQLTATEARYRAQYSALDVMLTNMSQTSTFLTQQLAALTASTG